LVANTFPGTFVLTALSSVFGKRRKLFAGVTELTLPRLVALTRTLVTLAVKTTFAVPLRFCGCTVTASPALVTDTFGGYTATVARALVGTDLNLTLVTLVAAIAAVVLIARVAMTSVVKTQTVARAVVVTQIHIAVTVLEASPSSEALADTHVIVAVTAALRGAAVRGTINQRAVVSKMLPLQRAIQLLSVVLISGNTKPVQDVIDMGWVVLSHFRSFTGVTDTSVVITHAVTAALVRATPFLLAKLAERRRFTEALTLVTQAPVVAPVRTSRFRAILAAVHGGALTVAINARAVTGVSAVVRTADYIHRTVCTSEAGVTFAAVVATASMCL